MKKFNKIFSLILALFLIVGCGGTFATKQLSAYHLTNGEKVYNIIGDRIMYATEEVFDETIVTFEATIKLPKSLADEIEGGVIFSNYFQREDWFGDPCSFYVGTKGKFKIGWSGIVSPSGSAATFEYMHTFEGVDLRTGNWEHIAVVYDRPANSMHYYVNGELIETHTPSTTIPYKATSSMIWGVGSDWNNWLGKKTPFYGEIKQITVYGNALTQSQIKNDIGKQSITCEERQGLNLMGNWYFGEYWGQDKIIYNTAKQGQNCVRYTYDAYVPVDIVGMDGGWDYSFAIIPDIQAMTHNKHDNLRMLSQWLIDNKESHNIQFVQYLGDLGECQYADESKRDHVIDEWNYMADKIHMLDNKVPYSVVLGNHDYDDWCRTNRNTTMFDKHFKHEQMKNLPGFGGVFKEGEMDNSYMLINVPGTDIQYLIFSLEHTPRYTVLNWMDRIISEHPNARVIYSSHALVFPDGNFVSGADLPNPNSHSISSYSQVEIWDKIARKHPNIFMNFSGHYGCDAVVTRTDIGDHGNKVYSTLVDFQGAMLTSKMNTFLLIKVDEDTKLMSFCAYSPEMDACYNEQNQWVFSFADENNPTIGGVGV